MVMDSGLQEFSGMMSGWSNDDSFSDQNIFRAIGLREPQPYLGFSHSAELPQMASGTNTNANPTSSTSTITEGDSPEDGDIFCSDMSLSYISKILMEEDIDGKISTYTEESTLRAAEKPFYDILGQNYPPSPERPPLEVQQSLANLDFTDNRENGNLCSSCGTSKANGFVGNSFISDSSNGHDLSSQSSSFSNLFPSPSNSSNCISSEKKPVVDVSMSPSLFFKSMPAWHFKKGVEEASKFLPSNDKLAINLDVSPSQLLRGDRPFITKAKLEARECLSYGFRGRKNPSQDDLDLVERRSNKQSAVSSEGEMRSEMFDMILLCQRGKCQKNISALREEKQNEAIKLAQNCSSKGLNGGKTRGKKQTKKEVVDLRTLLIHCAQAVAADDRQTADQLLKQIRQHSSPDGDATQKLAYCFADGLEARLAGTGSQIYHALVAKRTTATDILKAYHLYLAACPFKRISYFFANQTILNVTDKASKVHIIDFGIYFGFQWPCLIQRLSARDGDPPNLRITGIDVPQPGFRPTERIEETGRRLADYAKSFNIPFEYQAIASKWENIQVEDLHINKDEVVVVNCLYRFRNLVDETVVVDSPRNRVLNMIRRMNPDVFIHGIVNGSYSAPFFITRFREALFHYSALFDMLETNVARHNEQRLLIERDLFGRDALNVIACEGSERVERPETCKQWQVRNLRAGFEQLPLNPDIVKKAKHKVKTNYHRDFLIGEDNRWLIQGWKGRIIYAISTWKPNDA
ncbi:scarecrow-like protein 9 [Curcuma longa]|uniref:scarecrow-like protein 9 n=1 Tax=Curcuma longa TaxID=136217 RepID=UPI003D9F0C40